MRGALVAGGAAAMWAAALRGAEDEILVFAAASLSDAVAEVAADFEATRGVAVACNFAGSNILVRQVQAGAPADVLITAHQALMEELIRGGAVAAGTVGELAGNALVVVVPKGNPRRLNGAEDLLAFDRVAVVDPEAGPAGLYARSWLRRSGVWERLVGRLVPTLDVRAALAAVATGNLPAGIVYSTDAASTSRVEVAYVVPPEEAPRISYVAAPLRRSRHAGVRDFMRFLRGSGAAETFRRHGFEWLSRSDQ